MKIRGYSWAGAPTSDFDRTNLFFREDLGLEMLMRDDERMIGIFKLPTGQLFEVFGPGNRYQQLMNSPAIAFDVDDIEGARAELKEGRQVRFRIERDHTETLGPFGDRRLSLSAVSALRRARKRKTPPNNSSQRTKCPPEVPETQNQTERD
jgi:hypothetical protein